ncbi:MAG: bifunctional diaminohydroxyphosphoribosylaminopyrimidine deaminase/5-amino-6-(5-phosphoribosylamino)uracil reductase RibD, partial [Alphaproteobacteria bacterium]|nr:bifunctional diaminohydroxyphosphoribosylaminopyrimidine deaminase/5-amino-6-(5-phosphoribosylamino)uracil reductase RibD [Alphaproteobacteria bacterium]
RVSGRGIARLEQAGIQVETGVCRDEANRLNQGFFKCCTANKPLVTLKIATSLDGRIASASGRSRWITGPASRRRGHLLRANHDAILVGIGTVLADDPSLDCRLPGLLGHSPLRIVVDSHLRITEASILVATAQEIPTWVITTAGRGKKSDRLEKSGVTVISCGKDDNGRVDLAAMLTRLSEKGITRLLVEGGGQVNASLIRASLVDRLYWFRSPGIIGGDGVAALPSVGVTELAEMPQFSLVRSGQAGKDSWQEFETGY